MALAVPFGDLARIGGGSSSAAAAASADEEELVVEAAEARSGAFRARVAVRAPPGAPARAVLARALAALASSGPARA